MASKPRRFSGRVLKQGPNPYVVVPASVSAAFARYAEKGRVRVHGTLEGAEIRGNLVPRAGGHWLFLHAGMRAAAGVVPGNNVELVLRATSWDEVPIARDTKAALSRAGALKTFEAMSPAQRHELQRWVDVAETAEQRKRRLAEMLKQVGGRSEPVKRGRAARRNRALWTCPKCDHVFVNRNQWHSCRRYTVDQTFAGSEPAVRELFEKLRAMVDAVGPAHVQAYRDMVAFVVRVRFLAAMPRKKWLDLGFWLPRRIESPRFHKVETLTPTDHVHLLRIRRPGDLDREVSAWIRQGYAAGEQRQLV